MCDALAVQYASETGVKNPSDVTVNSERASYLKSRSYWTCNVPGTNEIVKVTDSQDEAAVAKICKNYHAALPTDQLHPSRPPLYLYQEEGFVPWVNDHGMRCINSVTGVFHGVNTKPTYTDPDSKTTIYQGAPLEARHRPAPAQCSEPCFRVTGASDECFTCVAAAIVQTPALCAPTFVGKTAEEIAATLKEAVTCTSCVGKRAIQINKHGARDKDLTDPAVMQELQALQAEHCWDCVLGAKDTHSFVNTKGFIVMMVCIGILLLVTCVVVVVVLVERQRRPKATTSDKAPATQPVTDDAFAFDI